MPLTEDQRRRTVDALLAALAAQPGTANPSPRTLRRALRRAGLSWHIDPPDMRLVWRDLMARLEPVHWALLAAGERYGADSPADLAAALGVAAGEEMLDALGVGAATIGPDAARIVGARLAADARGQGA